MTDLPQWNDRGDTAWFERAACKGMDTNLFFPERGAYPSDGLAVTTCGECPVRKECLEYSLVNKIKHGVWGGLSTRKRTR